MRAVGTATTAPCILRLWRTTWVSNMLGLMSCSRRSLQTCLRSSTIHHRASSVSHTEPYARFLSLTSHFLCPSATLQIFCRRAPARIGSVRSQSDNGTLLPRRSQPKLVDRAWLGGRAPWSVTVFVCVRVRARSRECVRECVSVDMSRRLSTPLPPLPPPHTQRSISVFICVRARRTRL